MTDEQVIKLITSLEPYRYDFEYVVYRLEKGFKVNKNAFKRDDRDYFSRIKHIESFRNSAYLKDKIPEDMQNNVMAVLLCLLRNKSIDFCKNDIKGIVDADGNPDIKLWDDTFMECKRIGYRGKHEKIDRSYSYSDFIEDTVDRQIKKKFSKRKNRRKMPDILSFFVLLELPFFCNKTENEMLNVLYNKFKYYLKKEKSYANTFDDICFLLNMGKRQNESEMLGSCKYISMRDRKCLSFSYSYFPCTVKGVFDNGKEFEINDFALKLYFDKFVLHIFNYDEAGESAFIYEDNEGNYFVVGPEDKDFSFAIEYCKEQVGKDSFCKKFGLDENVVGFKIYRL